MNARAFLLLTALPVAAAVRAELPAAVAEACLAPTLTEQATGKSWAAMSRAKWDSAPVRVHERDGLLIAEMDGAEHPSGWVKTLLTLSQKPQTAAEPRPVQTFTVTATPTGVLPRTRLVFDLLKAAPLPPCSVKAWAGRPALVADAGDWYVIAADPKAEIVRAEGTPPRWTLTVRAATDGRSPLKASILVGEGPLPPEPRPAEAAPVKAAAPTR